MFWLFGKFILSSSSTKIHTGAQVFRKTTMRHRARLRSSWVNARWKELFGRLADIFANNTVISPWRAKHASVCLLIPHKRKVYSFVLLHKQRQTFPFIVQASSPFFWPLLLWAQEGHSQPGTSLEVFRPHTEQAKISPWLSFFFSFLSSLHTV